MNLFKRSGLLLVFYLAGIYLTAPFASAQSGSEIYHQLLKLKETKRVLYIAAHPDDENTRLIAYLSNAINAEVGYLSLTRGDGGQNLIGKELGIQLGMIRTQELLKARETDGGRQFFSRAIDFGYSKTPNETLNNWDREKLLSDVIWVIRNFQPDIIITRFNTTPGTTHGHHTTSAILAREAYEKAGDPNVFPEQMKWVKPWSPKRIFWNAYNWGGQYEPKADKKYHSFPVGEFNALLGTTYSQIAADSRTMHKSQGFGATAAIGEGSDFIELVAGASFESGPFDGIPNRWENLEKGSTIQHQIQDLLEDFNFIHPEKNLPELLAIKSALNDVQENLTWVKEKRQLMDEIILAALGWKSLFLANKELSYPSEQIKGRLLVNQPYNTVVNLHAFRTLDTTFELDATVNNNKPFELEMDLQIPKNHPISQPYWLENDPENNLYAVEEQPMIGKAFNDPAISGILHFDINGQSYEVNIPLQYRYNDQVNGEIIQPFTIVPKASVTVDMDNVFLLNGKESIIGVTVTFEGEMKEGKLGIEGLDSAAYRIEERLVDEVNNRYYYKVALSNSNGEEKSHHTVYFETEDGMVFKRGMNRILYEHIPNQTYFPEAAFNLIRMKMDISNQTIGYIPGAGDDIPGVLRNLGYTVEMLENDNFGPSVFSKYNTIIVGIRAFNVNQNFANSITALMEYVKEGGNLIVQYNTSSPLLSRNFGPYPLELSRNRVAVEDSPVEILLKDHPLMNHPNKIEQVDFSGWVQERGLYFPGNWDDTYQTPLLMQDPDETPTKGSLLFANYGQGSFTYSGISWFRLLPAGVPGAVKLFVNLIEQAGEEREGISALE
ncbi:PIG-L family deacetylase [Cyclobacterium plantarum]|uniref:PIG-L family deacetylase n=1 Tax=Cyclobacterium plantarum TaxID=2716263 RepID=A0ABX0HCW8_9BACT|nr:PIG-L family deacetylase [Cyclobacterium plantarum]NHE58763.1 PIG-L family deacetylase [Cyclobacterium plantarum]